MSGPGPTGKFPRGKLTEHDDGELEIRFEIRDREGVILMHFGKPITWFGMTADDAEKIADMLAAAAAGLRERGS